MQCTEVNRPPQAPAIARKRTEGLEQKAADIKAEMLKLKKERLVNRINPHTTAEASRIISEVGAKK